MKILFLTIGSLKTIESHEIYPDLLRRFRDNGHTVYTVSPYEKRTGLKTELRNDNGVNMLHVRIGNITKCGLIEKGISTLRIESQFLAAIKKYFDNIKFDLILYSTPPITFAKVVKYVKKRDNAKSYLLLKDIFPQNAVDLGIMRKSGLKGILYRYFRHKEKKLYAISDYIGCMSEANVEYVLRHNPEIPRETVEVCPNAVDIIDTSVDEITRSEIRAKYGIPSDKKVFVYGGNLGRPQGIPHLMKCLLAERNNPDAFFLIVGSGTEYKKLETFVAENDIPNMKLMSKMPKEDYDKMVGACDVGMIFLDHRFTIPNFPSRLLAYMQAKLPVLAVTDPNTDVGEVCINGGFGMWCEANDPILFSEKVAEMLDADLKSMGERGFEYLNDNYTSQHGYEIIIAKVEEKDGVTA